MNCYLRPEIIYELFRVFPIIHLVWRKMLLGTRAMEEKKGNFPLKVGTERSGFKRKVVCSFQGKYPLNMDVAGKLTMHDKGCEISLIVHQKDHAKRITMHHKNFNYCHSVAKLHEGK